MEIAPAVDSFQKFIRDDITSAVKELNRIRSEDNRKHLQRLVYTNLVNRFDLLLDTLLLKFSATKSSFRDKVLSQVKTDPAYLRDVYDILLSPIQENL